MKLNKFMPLQKMEEQADGSLFVFGIVTAEQPDLDKEVCDYATTKALYEQRTAENMQKTSVAGMTPSLMPMREMHQLITQGAGRSLVCDDATKTIRMGFHVVDENAVKKWKAGCFVGFSQGGGYVKRWPDPDFNGCTRYTADPSEVSAVDAPCLPIALVETMKGRAVTLAKASGATEEIALQVAEPPKAIDAATLLSLAEQLTTKERVQRALKAVDWPREDRKTILKAAEGLGITLTDRDKDAMARSVAKASAAQVKKSLYEVGWLAQLIEDLHWLCLQTEFERDMEDDGSKVPDGLRDAWMSLIAEFKAMAVEEANELAAAGGKGDAVKITDQAGLTKAAKTIQDHLENLKEKHEALGEHLKKAHEAEMKKHEALGDHIEKCLKCVKDAADGEEPEAAEKNAPVADSPALKALQEELVAMKKSQDELVEKLSKLPAAPPAHTGATNESRSELPAGEASFFKGTVLA